MTFILKFILVFLLRIGTVFAAEPEEALVGEWVSIDAIGTAVPGTISLNKNKAAKLAPQNLSPLVGKWSVSGSKLTLSMPPYGTSVMDYKLISKNKLRLTYSATDYQTFKRTSK